MFSYSDDLLAEMAAPLPRLERLDDLPAVRTVLMRLPKSLGALEEYVQSLSRVPQVKVIAGGRVKHMTPSMNVVLEQGFTRVRASRGRHKSRVLSAELPRPSHKVWPRTAFHGALDLQVVAHGAVFAGTRLDRGTQFLLNHLPAVNGVRAIDLGSGTGLIACTLARQNNQVTAVDISRAACLSTAATAMANRLPVEVLRLDALTGYPRQSADLIVCNPPFHVGTTKDSTPAERMMRTAAPVLVPGGEMWMVFNSHLPYRDMLRAIIGPTRVEAQNEAYTVTRSVRRD